MSEPHPLIHQLRDLRAKIASGQLTLDAAAKQLGDDPEVGLTKRGARDLLTKTSAEVEGKYRRIFETADLELKWLRSQ